MRYKTIIQELLPAYPEIHRRLVETRQLLPALDSFAAELKSSHLNWIGKLRQSNPTMDEPSAASAALELALAELQNRLSLQESEHERETMDQADATADGRQRMPPE